MKLSQILYVIIKTLNSKNIDASNVNIKEAFFKHKHIKINNDMLNEELLALIENDDIFISINKNSEIVYFSREITWVEIIKNLIINHLKSNFFILEDLYQFEKKLYQIFPNNNNIKAKIRQTLQKLRDDEIIIFLDNGQYEINKVPNNINNLKLSETFQDKLSNYENEFIKLIGKTIKHFDSKIVEFNKKKIIGYRYEIMEGKINPYWFWIRRNKIGELEFVLRNEPTSKETVVSVINQANIKCIIKQIENVFVNSMPINNERNIIQKRENVENRSNNYQEIKENLMVEKYNDTEEKRHETQIEGLYKKIIEGYILFKNDFVDIILDHDILLNIFDIEKHEKTKILYKYFKWFKEYNNKDINDFLNDNIDYLTFKTNCLNKEKRFDKDMLKNKHYNINKLYDLFLNTVMFFDYKEKNFKIEDLDILLYHYNFKSYRYKGFEFLNKYWNIFLKINKNSQTYFEFIKNKNLFKDAISFYNNSEKLYEQLKNIDNNNLNYFVDSIFNNNLINIKLKSNSIITVDDFVKISLEDFISIFETVEEFNEANIIINYLQENIKDLIIKYYFDVIDYRNNQSMIIRRANGETLNSIAVDYHLTRERVRQIVDRSNNIYKEKIKKYNHNLFKFLNKTGSYILEKQLDQIFDKDSIIVKFYLKYVYKTKSDIIIIDFKFNKLLSYIYNWVNESGENYYYIDELDEVVNNLKVKLNQINLNFTNDIIKHLITNNYFKEEKYYFKTTPTLVDKYEIILRYHFTEGLSQENIQPFRDEYFKVFKDFSIYERSDRAIFVRAVNSENVVLTDRGTYVYRKPGSIKLNFDLLQKIEKFILDNKTVYTANIFYLFNEDLKEIIDNRYELHSVLKEHFPNFYFRRDVIGVNEKPSLFIGYILEEFALNNEGYIRLKNIEKNIPILAGISLDNYVANNRRFVSVSNDLLIHRSFLYFDEIEMEYLNNLILNDLKNKIPVRTNKVYDYMKKYAPNMFEQNKIDGSIYAYNLFKYFYPRGYLYDFPFIRWDLENLGYRTDDYIISEFSAVNIFEITDIINFSKDMGLVINNMKLLLEKFYDNGYMRINENIIGRTENILNNMVKINEIINVIYKMLDRVNQINLDMFNFSYLPKINIPWNKHLLSHLVMNTTNHNIEVNTDGVSYNNLNYILRKKVF